jgi:alpha-ketoglutarate-dependent taurine dioxygenase
MAARQAMFQLRRHACARAWSVKARQSVRGFASAGNRWQEQFQTSQAASVSDGVAPHIIGSAPQKVAFQDVSRQSVRPAYGSRVPIELDGKTEVFDSIWLRDSCKCPRCVNPSSTQRTFQTADIPATIEGSAQVTTELEDEEVALISWKNDVKDWPEGHQTALPLDFLRKALEEERNVKAKRHPISPRSFWESQQMTKDIQYIDYGSYMRNDKTLYRALRALYTHGLVFLKNVPDTIATDSATSVKSICERIGHLRTTFYGTTWDVRSIPNAKNVAYTHVFLGLHMDLCYLDLTPHLQFLHSMRARAPGGESMFSDAFYAAEKIRQESPELFEALATFPVTFNYYNDGQAYRQIRPTIELLDQSDLNSPIKLLNYSPPFQGPYAHDIGTADGGAKFRAFHAGMQRFDELVNAPENMFEYRMEEGECVVFDNRRVLHARRAFEADKGERWLKGAYADRDVYFSRLKVLEDVYGDIR